MARHLREYSAAASSLRGYARAFSNRKLWTHREGILWHLNLKLDEQVRTIYNVISDANKHGLGSNRPAQSSTIKYALQDIRHFLSGAGHEFPAVHPQVRMILRGVSRSDAPTRRKTPVSVALLEECLRSLSLHDPANQATWERGGCAWPSFSFCVGRKLQPPHPRHFGGSPSRQQTSP